MYVTIVGISHSESSTELVGSENATPAASATRIFPGERLNFNCGKLVSLVGRRAWHSTDREVFHSSSGQQDNSEYTSGKLW